MTFCGCGCGEETKNGSRFIYAHNLRKNHTPKLEKKMLICSCGCGQEIIWRKEFRWLKKYPRFIHGHNTSVSNPMKNPDTARKTSDTKKMQYSSGRMIPSTLGKKFSETTKQRIKQKALKRWSKWKTNPHFMTEFAKKQAIISTGKPCSENAKKKLSAFWTGKPCSEDKKKKISIANHGRKPAPQTIAAVKISRMHQVFPVKDSKIEVAMQNALTTLGIPFKKHVPLMGQPDIFIEPNICVFVDGCWHHACTRCLDASKFGAWQFKAIARAEAVNKKLKEDGYTVIRFWGHEINKDINACCNVILDEIQKKELITA